MANSLPDGYKLLKKTKAYINISKLTEGEYKYRITGKVIGGWVDWEDNKPKRYRPDQKPKHSYDESKPVKPFWVAYVWDYANEGLYVMDITQISIIDSLTMLHESEDWGDFAEYDIKIKKIGVGKDTKYAVSPVPHKDISPKILDALKEKPVRLEALYDGGDPWGDLEECDPLQLSEAADHKYISKEQVEELKTMLANQGQKFSDNVMGWFKKSLNEFTQSDYDKLLAHIANRRD